MSNNRQMPAPGQAQAQDAQKAPEPVLKDQDVKVENKEEVKPESVSMEVIALRDGFMFNRRIREGDKFMLKDKKLFATWFKCADPKMEAERVKFLADKKKRARKK